MRFGVTQAQAGRELAKFGGIAVPGGGGLSFFLKKGYRNGRLTDPPVKFLYVFAKAYQKESKVSTPDKASQYLVED